MSDNAIGPRVRALFGGSERSLVAAYRRFFVDLDVLADRLRSGVTASRILDMGCGEGLFTEKLARAYPEARITGIDITPRVGRLFVGDRNRVSFRQETAESLSRELPGGFDLIVVCDVLHHIPWSSRPGVLGFVRCLLSTGGLIVVKDWERRPNLVHLLGYLSDRWLTGDRIRYARQEELRDVLAGAFGAGAIKEEFRLPPWRNNTVFFVRPG
mgnify:CR=1 FL=1